MRLSKVKLNIFWWHRRDTVDVDAGRCVNRRPSCHHQPQNQGRVLLRTGFRRLMWDPSDPGRRQQLLLLGHVYNTFKSDTGMRQPLPRITDGLPLLYNNIGSMLCYNLGRNYLMQAKAFIVLIILSKRIFPSMKLRKRWNFLGRCLPLVIRVRLPCYLRLESPAFPPMDLPHPGGRKPPHLPNRKLRQWNTSISVPALSQHFPHLAGGSPHLYSNLRSTPWYNPGRHYLLQAIPFIALLIL